MSQNEHTPGPWRWMIDSTAKYFAIYASVNGGTKVICPVRIEDKTDAMLIAAAPELLEALKAIKRRLHFVGHPREPMMAGFLAPTIPDWRSEVAILEAALTKAEGRDVKT